MFFVYVLKSSNFQKTYVGMTSDIQKRLLEHNKGRGRFTRLYMPWNIVHAEEYDSLMEARNRERYLKTSTGRRFLAKNIFIKK